MYFLDAKKPGRVFREYNSAEFVSFSCAVYVLIGCALQALQWESWESRAFVSLSFASCCFALTTCCELIQGGQRVLKSFSKRWDAETASEDMMGITWSAGPGNSLVNMVS